MFSKPILQHSADDLKANLLSFIRQALSLSSEIQRLSVEIADFGTDVRHLGGVSVVDDALREWLRKVEKAATAESGGNEYNFEISLSNCDIRYPRSVPDTYDRFFRDGGKGRNYRMAMIGAEQNGVDAVLEIVDEMLQLIDFEGIAGAISSQAKCLKGAGYAAAANNIAEFLGLSGYTPTPTELNRRGLVFYAYYGANVDGMNKVNWTGDLSEVQKSLVMAEQDTGISGVSLAVNQVYRVVFGTSGLNPIPLRTTAGIPGVLEALFFKNKTRFTLEGSRADALLSFVAEHASVDLKSFKNAA